MCTAYCTLYTVYTYNLSIHQYVLIENFGMVCSLYVSSLHYSVPVSLGFNNFLCSVLTDSSHTYMYEKCCAPFLKNSRAGKMVKNFNSRAGKKREIQILEKKIDRNPFLGSNLLRKN